MGHNHALFSMKTDVPQAQPPWADDHDKFAISCRLWEKSSCNTREDDGTAAVRGRDLAVLIKKAEDLLKEGELNTDA